MRTRPTIAVEARARISHGDREGVGRRQPVTPVEEAAEAPALEKLQHHEGRFILPPVVDGHDVGMVERGGQLGLGAEAAEEPGVVGQGGVEDLDGDLPLEAHVPSGVDAPARPRPQGGDQAMLSP